MNTENDNAGYEGSAQDLDKFKRKQQGTMNPSKQEQQQEERDGWIESDAIEFAEWLANSQSPRCISMRGDKWQISYPGVFTFFPEYRTTQQLYVEFKKSKQ